MIADAFEIARTIWRAPAFQSALSTLSFLSGVSGCFWLLSKIVGYWALWIHEILFAELADCFAILYNGALAVAFATIIALSVGGAGGESRFWRQGLGFVFVYFVLSAAYSDPATHEIDDYSVLGYLSGLGGYLLFCVVPGVIDQPWIKSSFAIVVWMARGWIGRLLTLYGGYEMLRIGLRIVRQFLRPAPAMRLRQ